MNEKGVSGVIAGLIIFVIIFAGGLLFTMWLLKNMVQIGIGLMTIAVPFLLIIIGAVLVKKYLLEG
ncbi:MAG: hypothetical protein DRN78_00025 [Thermoproteota archaeon]|nr:MAG: hypothetical protein DRN78_00025 [Candidatus Korarchaeota archaeon]